MHISKSIVAAVALTIVSSASAAVSITSGQIGALFNSSGGMIPVGSIGLLIVDQSNNGLLNAAGTTLSVNSFLGAGSDDLIVGTYAATDLSGGQIGFDFSSTVINVTGNTNSSDVLYFVWFPTLSFASSQNTVVGGGVSYGAFTSAVKDEFADVAWVVASDGQNVGIFSYTASLGGNPAVTAGQATASLVTTGAIPEPASFAAIAGLGALAFCANRRRRSA